MTTTLDAPAVHTGPVPVARPRRRWTKKLTRAVHGSAAVVLFAALWELVPRFVLDESTRTFLPPLSEDLQALWGLIADGELAEHLQASIGRSAAGFALAVGAGVPLGLLIGWYRPVARFLQPLLELARNTAALALLPVFTLLLGIGELSKISLVFYACVWPVLLNTIAGVHSVDPLLVKAARSLALSSPRLFRKVILPAAVPTVFTGIRLAASYSILVLVAAEMVGAKAGLGYLINTTQVNFLIPQMYAGIIAVSVLGVLVNQGFVALERRFSTWRPKEKP
ncbi:ABC transporter permease [Amycolatopsis balhimycina DSM 5908]|uniref:ABC transporter permease n=1 Tax=Amycolatopsis balhimycina DSM 5908 TaxID=1081091 RepID=A0A428WNM6_AMYBA|nr:ABC transporter permease [Amycolatopsis balhimycina]RSM44650.1 ABC transporter permease [Amycolatopsis balhimycina DSM 5908]